MTWTVARVELQLHVSAAVLSEKGSWYTLKIVFIQSRKLCCFSCSFPVSGLHIFSTQFYSNTLFHWVLIRYRKTPCFTPARNNKHSTNFLCCEIFIFSKSRSVIQKILNRKKARIPPTFISHSTVPPTKGVYHQTGIKDSP